MKPHQSTLMPVLLLVKFDIQLLGGALDAFFDAFNFIGFVFRGIARVMNITARGAHMCGCVDGIFMVGRIGELAIAILLFSGLRIDIIVALNFFTYCFSPLDCGLQQIEASLLHSNCWRVHLLIQHSRLVLRIQRCHFGHQHPFAFLWRAGCGYRLSNVPGQPENRD